MQDMFDVTGLGERQGVSTFIPEGPATLFQQWIKPRNISMVGIWTIGAGGGGGGGLNTAAGVGRNGAGGGGTGGLSRLIIPAFCLPDILYVSPGSFGAGGVAGGAGGTGAVSAVSVQPTQAIAADRLVYANGGGGGASASTGGSAGAIATVANAPWSTFGLWQAQVGVAGAFGGTQNVGNDITALASFILCPGAGGGGSQANNSVFRGGHILVGGVLSAQVTGGVGGGTATNIVGGSGYQLWKPFCGTGGAGGGSNGATGTGGAGGDGVGYGCGGGGGAPGAGAGGAGGRGGDGIVIIVTW